MDLRSVEVLLNAREMDELYNALSCAIKEGQYKNIHRATRLKMKLARVGANKLNTYIGSEN